MSFLKNSVLDFEQIYGRNNASRRFVNYLIKGGMMNRSPGTPQRDGGAQRLRQTPLRVLSIGVSQTNRTARAMRLCFTAFYDFESYDVIRASNFLNNEIMFQRPYTHIIFTGHGRNRTGHLEDDDNNKFFVEDLLGRIHDLQNNAPFKLLFYNCEAYQDIFLPRKLRPLLSNFNVTQAFFGNTDLLRYDAPTYTKEHLINFLTAEQLFKIWTHRVTQDKDLEASLIELAPLFFDRHPISESMLESFRVQQKDLQMNFIAVPPRMHQPEVEDRELPLPMHQRAVPQVLHQPDVEENRESPLRMDQPEVEDRESPLRKQIRMEEIDLAPKTLF